MKEVIIAILIFLALGGAVYHEYGLLQQIDAQVTKLSLVNVNLQEATVSFDLRITNPAHLSVFVDSITVDLQTAGKTLARIEDTNSFELPAQGEASKTLVAKIPLRDLGMAGIQAFQQGKLSWEIDGSANIRVLGVPTTQTFVVQNNKA